MLAQENSINTGICRENNKVEVEVFGALAPLVAGKSDAEIDALAARLEQAVRPSLHPK